MLTSALYEHRVIFTVDGLKQKFLNGQLSQMILHSKNQAISVRYSDGYFIAFFQCASSKPGVGGAAKMNEGAVLMINQGDIAEVRVLSRPDEQDDHQPDSTVTSQISDPPALSYSQAVLKRYKGCCSVCTFKLKIASFAFSILQ